MGNAEVEQSGIFQKIELGTEMDFQKSNQDIHLLPRKICHPSQRLDPHTNRMIPLNQLMLTQIGEL
jgi:hypothetical protein